MWSIGKRSVSTGIGVVDFWRREIGDLNPRAFANRACASEDLVMRLKIDKKLNNHRGCVNTVSFNASGNILISGSDDRMVLLWDWDMGTQKLAFHSGHCNNVFQAKFVPFTDDRSIVTCAADGEVRFAQLADGGRVNVKLLANHEGRVHKIAIEPGSPHVFYSCGEDGHVLCFDLRKEHAMPLFTCKSLHESPPPRVTIHLNAITIDPRDYNFFAVAGSDEFVRLYDVRRFKGRGNGVSFRDYPINHFCPPHLLGNTEFGITGLAFSDQRELLASYGNEKIYLFSRNQVLGSSPSISLPRSSKNAGALVKEKCKKDFEDTELNDSIFPGFEHQQYFGHRNSETMKGVGFFGPNSEYVVSGSDCGRLFIWRKKDGLLLRAMEGDKYVVNCIESHPHAPVLVSSGIEDDVKIWVPNAAERSSLTSMDEVLNTPSKPVSLYYFRLMDLDDIYDDDEGEDDREDDSDSDSDSHDDDGNDGSDVGSGEDDRDDGGSSSDCRSILSFSDDRVDEYLSDHYLASGHMDDLL